MYQAKSEGSLGDTAKDCEEEGAVLDAFLETLLDYAAAESRDASAAGVKRAFNTVMQARVARGEGRARALDEGKLVLKGLVEAKKVMKRL